jgi:hypothetical protein
MPLAYGVPEAAISFQGNQEHINRILAGMSQADAIALPIKCHCGDGAPRPAQLQ